MKEYPQGYGLLISYGRLPSEAKWHRWMRACEERARFHEVQVVAPESRSADAGPVVVMSANGLRVEGLDVEAAAHLLRLLR